MVKACFVLLADTDAYEATGRIANAWTSAKGFVDAGDEAVVLFRGSHHRRPGEPRLPCSSPVEIEGLIECAGRRTQSPGGVR